MRKFFSLLVLFSLFFCDFSYSNESKLKEEPNIIFSASTLAATNFTDSTATFNAKITPNKTATYFFRYGVHNNSPFGYKFSWKTAKKTIKASSKEVLVSEEISNLIPSTKYFYKVVAANDETTKDGDVKFFKTTNE